MLHEPTPASLDLHPTLRLLLDILDITAPLPDDLRAEVEAGDGLEVDWDTLFRPFATPERIALNRLWFSATESTLVDQVGEFLLHELVDLLHGFVETVFARARDVEVEGRVLKLTLAVMLPTYGKGCDIRPA